MPRSSKAGAIETERRIRDVARDLFAQHGYADVSLEDVAAAAGVTRGAVYHHFDGRRGLFSAVLSDAHARIAESVEDAAAGDGWPAIERGSIAFLRAAVDPAVRRIVLVDGRAVLGWDEWRRADGENAARLLEEGLRALPDLAVPADAAAAALSGAMNECAVWISRGGDPAAAEDTIRTIIRGLRR